LTGGAIVDGLFEPVSFSLGAILAGILGALGTHLWRRYRNRMVLISWQARHQPVAVETDHATFGKVEVLYNGRPTHNVTFTTIALKNESNKDLEDVVLDFFFRDGTTIFMAAGNVRGSGNPLVFTKEFSDNIDLALAMKEDDPQRPAYITALQRERHFNVPVWNREGNVTVELLVQPPRGVSPVILVSTDHVGVKMQYSAPKPLAFGEHQVRAAMFGLAAAVLLVILLAQVLRQPLILSLGAVTLGAMTTLIGALLIKLGRQVMRVLG